MNKETKIAYLILAIYVAVMSSLLHYFKEIMGWTDEESLKYIIPITLIVGIPFYIFELRPLHPIKQK